MFYLKNFPFASNSLLTCAMETEKEDEQKKNLYLCALQTKDFEKMRKRLVIFDLDGTLLNTIADLAQSTNQALQHLGYPTHPVEAYHMMVGNGIAKLLERALPAERRTPEEVQRMKALFVPHYDVHNADRSTPYPGIEKLLVELQEEGFLLAVASNKYQAATEKLVAHYFPNIRFAAVLGQRDGVPVKPDPQIVADIMSLTATSRREILYVGDSGVDMQTATRAQVDACGVCWGFRSREELASYQPALLVDKAEEVAAFLHQS